MTFPDHFSGHADRYARFRPKYPAELFIWLASRSPALDCAWDCGAGSGQAAVGLAEHFAKVIATDASERQIRQAEQHARVAYRVAPAEASGLSADSVDLAVVAQALHWFDLDRFYPEVRHVVHRGGVFAAWSYALATITPAVDAVVGWLYEEIVGRWWPPERRFVEERYATLAFPFPRIDSPPWEMTATWNLEELTGYLRTWSAVEACRSATGRDPLQEIEDALAAAWGDPRAPRRVTWPLTVLAGRVE